MVWLRSDLLVDFVQLVFFFLGLFLCFGRKSCILGETPDGFRDFFCLVSIFQSGYLAANLEVAYGLCFFGALSVFFSFFFVPLRAGVIRVVLELGFFVRRGSYSLLGDVSFS